MSSMVTNLTFGEFPSSKGIRLMSYVPMTYQVVNPLVKDKSFAYQSEGSSGIDLYAAIDIPLFLQPGEVQLISTGIKLKMHSQQITGFILPRSGLGHKSGIILGNGTGVIDSNYRGELFMSVWNRSDEMFTIEPLSRICQIVFLPIIQVKMIEGIVGEDTERGSGGFGSTGTL